MSSEVKENVVEKNLLMGLGLCNCLETSGLDYTDISCSTGCRLDC